MVVLRDFPYKGALFGWVSYNDPCNFDGTFQGKIGISHGYEFVVDRRVFSISSFWYC